MRFDADTYVVLDVPEPAASQVMAIRKRHRDEFRASLPVEITLIGSSGVGVFDAAQDPKAAFAALDAIAAETAPIQACFGSVLRFPNTDIFVFTLQDESPLRALHERIAKSGLSFTSSPFPFTPHCTLRSRSPVSDEDVAELLSLQVPESFVLDTMSVYMLRMPPAVLLYRVELTGRPPADRTTA
jgi:2'-5' RNA ligase